MRASSHAKGARRTRLCLLRRGALPEKPATSAREVLSSMAYAPCRRSSQGSSYAPLPLCWMPSIWLAAGSLSLALLPLLASSPALQPRPTSASVMTFYPASYATLHPEPTPTTAPVARPTTTQSTVSSPARTSVRRTPLNRWISTRGRADEVLRLLLDLSAGSPPPRSVARRSDRRPCPRGVRACASGASRSALSASPGMFLMLSCPRAGLRAAAERPSPTRDDRALARAIPRRLQPR